MSATDDLILLVVLLVLGSGCVILSNRAGRNEEVIKANVFAGLAVVFAFSFVYVFVDYIHV